MILLNKLYFKIDLGHKIYMYEIRLILEEEGENRERPL